MNKDSNTDNNEDDKILKMVTDIFNSNQLNLEDIDLQHFAQNIIPFIHLIDYWASITGLLLFKCDNFRYKRKIIKNLSDENCEELTHVESFYSFLCQCNGENSYASLQDIMSRTKNNEIIEEYKNHIKYFVNRHSFDDCCQMLGAAEYAYLLVSNRVAELYLKYIGKYPTKHYVGNNMYGKKHAFNFFDCVENKKMLNINNFIFGVRWITFSMGSLLQLPMKTDDTQIASY